MPPLRFEWQAARDQGQSGEDSNDTINSSDVVPYSFLLGNGFSIAFVGQLPMSKGKAYLDGHRQCRLSFVCPCRALRIFLGLVRTAG